MSKTPLLVALVGLCVWSSQALARGGQAGPIGPGSRDGLTPSASNSRPTFYETERAAPVVKMRSRKFKRK